MRDEQTRLILRFIFFVVFADSKSLEVESATEPVQDTSGEEVDDEWDYKKTRDNQTEKAAENFLSEEFPENMEPVTQKEISSIELKEQLDTAAAELVIFASTTAPAIAEPIDDVSSLFLHFFCSYRCPIGKLNAQILF